MSEEQARATMVAYWMQKAEEAIAAVRRECSAGDLGLAINRVYYACFHAASAQLLSEGRTFVKHAGVRSAVHQHLVKTGRIPPAFGELYDRAFDDRMEADYQIVTPPEPAEVARQIEGAEQFVAEMKKLIGR
jgi:uncharacterized protein (UPF0332 family)